MQLKTEEIAAPKPDLGVNAKKDDFEARLKSNFKMKSASAKIEKICWQITIATLIQQFQYDWRRPAAKDNSITHAAAEPSNLDATITMRSPDIELQNALVLLRAAALEIAAPKPDLGAKAKKKHDFEALFKGF